ncbi:MAG: BatA domain-containing protein [Planctomycetota bacterium]|nr:BatA domain-containing protein [Planctomycetota bacterium]
MAFLNASMMIGGLLVAVPFLIHLAMRRKPTLAIFPALQFVQQKQVTNKRVLHFKQWLLLFLRSLLIALLVFALAGPSAHRIIAGNWLMIGILGLFMLLVMVVLAAAVVSRVHRYVTLLIAFVLVCLTGVNGFFLVRTLTSDQANLLGDEDAAVSAVFVFDNSPRMQYQQNDESRLAVAQSMGDWLARQLPEESQIAVVDLDETEHVFSQDLNSAIHAMNQLRISYTPHSLDISLRRALELIHLSDLPRSEMYVFTDLSQAAWESVSPTLQKSIEALGVELFLIDVGVERPSNVALDIPRLSRAVLTEQGAIQLDVRVQSIGELAQRTVTLKMENHNPTLPIISDGHLQTPTTRNLATQVVSFPDSETATSQMLSFTLSDLSPGEHHGRIELTGVDGLAVDDRRFFTVSVRPAWQILMVAPPGIPTRFLTQAIAPESERASGQSQYQIKIRRDCNLAGENLEPYASVVLIDPTPLSPESWDQLAGYVSTGGALCLCLGHNMTVLEQGVGPELMGGRIRRQWRAAANNFLEPRNQQHRALRLFQGLQGSVPWAQFPVSRYWQMENLTASSQVVMQFSNTRHPALVENQYGEGMVLTLLTPISDPFQIADRAAWNELVSGDDNWPYFLLANGLADALVSTGESQFNYQAGEKAVLRNNPHMYPDRYQLFTPDADVQETRVVDGKVEVGFTNVPGAYRLKGNLAETMVRGFSVNVAPVFSELVRLEPSALDQRLGATGFQRARSREEIEFGVRQQRIGQEFYPLLLVLFAVVFFLEHLLASRFYGQRRDSKPSVVNLESSR